MNDGSFLEPPFLEPRNKEELERYLRKIIPEGAHPSTLAKATAFYDEIKLRPKSETALLMAYQQTMIEGLAAALAEANAASQTSSIVAAKVPFPPFNSQRN